MHASKLITILSRHFFTYMQQFLCFSLGGQYTRVCHSPLCNQILCIYFEGLCMKPPKFYEFRISISYWKKAETKESHVVQGLKFSGTGYYAMGLCTRERWSSNLHCTLQFSLVSIIPPLLHTHSSIYNPRCIMFFSQYFSFPLSVPFHHCSILIHPSTTHAV